MVGHVNPAHPCTKENREHSIATKALPKLATEVPDSLANMSGLDIAYSHSLPGKCC